MRINKFWVCSVEDKWIQIRKTRQVIGIKKKKVSWNWELRLFYKQKKEHYCLPGKNVINIAKDYF